MKRGLTLIACLLAFGCEDTYVREHIIDNFVCVYMPWWMGECDGDEVTAKVMGVLDHGLVEAKIECDCSAEPIPPALYSYPVYPFVAQKLIDGSCLVSGGVPTRLYERSDARSASCDTYPGQGANAHVATGGVLLVDSSANTPTHSVAITTCCTGFNLAAFGVEE